MMTRTEKLEYAAELTAYRLLAGVGFRISYLWETLGGRTVSE